MVGGAVGRARGLERLTLMAGCMLSAFALSLAMAGHAWASEPGVDAQSDPMTSPTASANAVLGNENLDGGGVLDSEPPLGSAEGSIPGADGFDPVANEDVQEGENGSGAQEGTDQSSSEGSANGGNSASDATDQGASDGTQASDPETPDGEEGSESGQDAFDPEQGDESTASSGKDDNGESAQKSEKSEEANPPAKKHDTPLASGTYVISSSVSWKQVVDVSKGSKSSGANVQVYNSNMTGAQQWKITYDDEGLYTFVNVKSGKALDVSGGIMKNGRNVQQYNSNGTAAQKWIIISTPTGYKICSAKDSSFVLDLAAARAVNGGNIQIYRSNNTKAQRFWFLEVDPTVEAGAQEVADGVYVISSSKKGSVVLDAASAGTSNGTNVQAYGSNNTIAQKWVLSYSNGFYTIANVASGKVLDVSGANLVPTTNVQLYTSNGTPAQKWALSKNADGTFCFVNKANGLVLDLANGSVANGANIWVYRSNGTAAQKFVLTATDMLSAGTYAIYSHIAGNRVMDVPSASGDAGKQLQLYSSNDSLAQRFVVKRVAENTYAIQAACSGKYLTASNGKLVQTAKSGDLAQQWTTVWRDGGIVLINKATGQAVAVGSSAVGAKLAMATLSGAPGQAFRFANKNLVVNGVYCLDSQIGGRTLDVSSASKKDRANVQIWQKNGTNCQKWRITSLGGGYYKIVNALSGKALDVAGGAKGSGANVQQYKWNGTAAQRWRIEVSDAGGLVFVNQGSGKVLDVSSGSNRNGANVQIWEGNNTSAQRWGLTKTTVVKSGMRKLSNGSWQYVNDNGVVDRSNAINRLMSTAKSLLGVPYVWLGKYPQDGGMDCASFTWHVYRQIGVTIGFETYYQIDNGYEVPLSKAKPGDLILMYFSNRGPEHVVLYAGNGMIYEEPDFGGHCQYVPLSSKHAGYVKVRRIIAD